MKFEYNLINFERKIDTPAVQHDTNDQRMLFVVVVVYNIKSYTLIYTSVGYKIECTVL